MKLPAAILFLALAFTATAAPPPSIVTRSEVMATAKRYHAHVWTPTEKNILHGRDSNGIRVDTPDANFQPKKGSSGWWRPGVKNTGIPYKWGGFDTPESFDAGILEGRPAGDTYTAEKRRLLDAAASRRAVGIDCSGLVSRCWNLPRSYSTRTITQFCDPVPDARDAQPGDIFNTKNAHALLFVNWARPDHSRLLAFETGAPPVMKVLFNEMGTGWLLEKGYTVWRYRGIRDRREARKLRQETAEPISKASRTASTPRTTLAPATRRPPAGFSIR